MSVIAELADGRKLEFPDGTDPAVVQATVKKIISGNATAPARPSKQENIIDRAISGALSRSPRLTNALESTIGQGSTAGRVIQGAADMPVGLLQLGMNLTGHGDKINPEIAAINRRTEALRGPDAGFDWARFAGNFASPASWMAAAKVPVAATTAGKMAQGAATGAAFGAAAPVTTEGDYAGEKAAQIGAGAAVGGVLPPLAQGVTKGASIVRNVIDPLLPGGTARSAVRLANTAAGDRRDAVIAAMTGARSGVPGSTPTAGQAAVPAGSAEFSALQKAAQTYAPSEYAAIDAAQQGARKTAMQTVGGTPQTLEAAVASRGAQAGRDYGAAYGQAIKADPELARLAKNPFVAQALPDAQRLAAAEGINPKTDLTRFLHFVKLSLDKQIAKTGDTALSNTERRAAGDAKDALVAWIAKKNPAYDAARANFAAASAPINEMQLGQFLENKLTAPLGTSERAASFAQAVRDAPGTIRRATTGSQRYENLSDILTPQQMKVVNAITGELQRDVKLNDLAKRGAPEINRMIGETIPQLPPTGAFQPMISAARSWVNKALSGATDETMRELAKQMQNPQALATAMQAATPAQRQKIIEAIVKYQGIPQGAILADTQ